MCAFETFDGHNGEDGCYVFVILEQQEPGVNWVLIDSPLIAPVWRQQSLVNDPFLLLSATVTLMA